LQPDLLDAARTLAPRIGALAEETERGRRLPAELVAAFAKARLFDMCVPRDLGGPEVHPAVLVATVETLAAADGAAGWCAMIAATTSVLAAYLPDDDARTIYGTPGTATGGAYAPQGRATAALGGYRVTGRWPFASGCEHCAWLTGGSLLQASGGQPEARLMIFPAPEVEIIDTWNVSGLRGTGSHDIAVRDAFVPAGRAVSLTLDRPRRGGTLYAFPVFGLLALGGAAVALGIARRAVDELTAMAATKTATLQRRRLAERPVVQAKVAEAEALVGSARAFLLAAVARAWEAAERSREIPLADRAHLRLAATYAAATCARAVDLMYTAGGGTAIYASSPLQRCLRDAHAVTQHVMVAEPTYELVGRVLLGVDADTSQL
jgi:alkylation response protein AidB-like acyl-CoA dehydrogenase